MTLEEAQDQLGPGKFEGQPAWVPAAYDDSLNGCWQEHGSVDENGYHYSWVEVNDYVQKLCFGMLESNTFSIFLVEDSQGFVRGEEATVRDHDETMGEIHEDAYNEAG